MFASAVIVYDSFVWVRTKGGNITNDAKLSFLAGTRNLIVGAVQCSRWHLHCHFDKVPGPSQG